jgi:hypothetical protein
VDDALGDALVIEVKDFLAKVKIFQQRRSARTDAQRVLVVRDGDALLRRERRDVPARDLMRFVR